jgi:hypothetical protein
MMAVVEWSRLATYPLSPSVQRVFGVQMLRPDSELCVTGWYVSIDAMRVAKPVYRSPSFLWISRCKVCERTRYRLERDEYAF